MKIAALALFCVPVAVGGTLLIDVSQRAAQPERESTITTQPDGFRQVNRPGSVDLDTTYDLDNLVIPRTQIHTLLPRDAIPALTDPTLVTIKESGWIAPTDRIIAVTVGETTVGVPINILNYHEVANLTIEGHPIAATYCPLCDSATVVSRRVSRTLDDGTTVEDVLEFGVSGALYNSNVLMYDRTDLALWSQLGMQAVSGPLAGTSLDHLPVRLVSWAAFQTAHPDATVVSRETGHERDYTGSPYSSFFESDRMLVPVASIGDALPPKTLGLGVNTRGQAYFVAADAITEGFTLETDAGLVRARRTDAGIEVLEAPEHALTAQTFYYSWSAFYPDTDFIGPPEATTITPVQPED